MKKLLIFIGTMANGGAERVVSLVSPYLFETFDSVEIMTFLDDEVFYHIDKRIKFTVLEKCTHSKSPVKNVLYLRNYLKKNQIDEVLSFLLPFNIVAALAAWGTGIPVVLADRSDPRQESKNTVRRLLRWLTYSFCCKKVIFQNSRNLNYFSGRIFKKGIIIPNPVALELPDGAALLAEKKKTIVTVGRLTKAKNHPMLISAFNEVASKYPQYRLIIYGEGEERSNEEKVVRDKGLEEKVLLPGKFSDVHKRILEAELFVLSSDYEGMPNALAEAMVLGLPCISTDVSGSEDLIENGVSGIIVPRGNQEAMTGAITRMIEDANMRGKMGKKAVSVAEKLKIDNVAKSWNKVLSENI